jgi:hypothetical protein
MYETSSLLKWLKFPRMILQNQKLSAGGVVQAEYLLCKCKGLSSNLSLTNKKEKGSCLEKGPGWLHEYFSQGLQRELCRHRTNNWDTVEITSAEVRAEPMWYRRPFNSGRWDVDPAGVKKPLWETCTEGKSQKRHTLVIRDKSHIVGVSSNSKLLHPKKQ